MFKLDLDKLFTETTTPVAKLARLAISQGCDVAANDPDDQAENEREAIAERAAVMEFDGGLVRDLAEKMAKASHVYLAHHWHCPTCRSAGRGNGSRCPTGSGLWANYQAAEDAADAANPKEGGVSK